MSSKNIWFITGVSSGLGLALALYVLKAGHTVYGSVRNRERAAEAVSQIEGAGGTCVVLDVTDLDSIPGVIEGVISKEGKIDVVVNNAGLGLLATVEDTSVEDSMQQMQTNFFGPLRLIQAVIPSMRTRKSGSIITISSALGSYPVPGHGLYAASKFALEGLSETLARELSSFNISVLIVQPGLFQTNFAKSAVISKLVPGTYDTTPLGQLYRRVESNVSQRNEIGDPHKAAKVIFKAVAGGHEERKIGKVLRLPLGRDASSMLRQKMESLREDYENTKEVAKSTDRDL